MHLRGQMDKVKYPALFVVAILCLGSAIVAYKHVTSVTPVSINKDPRPVALQASPLAPESGKPTSQSINKPSGTVGWSSDTAVRPAASAIKDGAKETAQAQPFPPQPRPAASDDKDLTQAQAQSTPPPQQWSGTVTVSLPPHFQANTKNNLGTMTATGLPTSITHVTEIRQKIAAGETFFLRPKSEKTPVKFQRDK